MKKSIHKLVLASALFCLGSAFAASVQLYKSPTCGCCEEYVRYLKAQGFQVQAVNRDEMNSIKRQGKVTPGMGSCHTAFIGGYTIEGHVPVAAIQKLLKEKPKLIGLSVPGMPATSPGMGDYQPGTIEVYALTPSGSTNTLYGKF